MQEEMEQKNKELAEQKTKVIIKEVPKVEQEILEEPQKIDLRQ